MSIKFSTTVRPMTKKIAQAHLELERLPRDRAIRERNYDYIKTKAMAGEWNPVRTATVFCKETGTTLAVNGNHSVSVIVNEDVPLKGVTNAHDDWTTDTLSEVIEIWTRYDSSRSVRTTGDINMAFASEVDKLASVKRGVINMAISGIGIAQYGFDYFMVDVEKRAQESLANTHFILWFDRMLSDGDRRYGRKRIKQAGVAAAMFKAWAEDARDADIFWSAVRDASEKNGTTTRKLGDELLAMTSSRSSRERHYEMAMDAWAAWQAGVRWSASAFLKRYAKQKDAA